jgi:hypothetical protein
MRFIIIVIRSSLLAPYVLALASAAVASAADPYHPDFDIQVPAIPGIEIEMRETQIVPRATSAIVFKCNDGRLCVVGPGDTDIWSDDGGKTWKEGPPGPGGKMAIDLGDGEILGFQRDMVPRADGKLTINYRRSTDNWNTVEATEGVADIPLADSMVGDDGKGLPTMLVNHGVVQLSDGRLLATLEGNYKGDSILADGYPPHIGMRKVRTVVISSSDRGKTWGNPITVGYDVMIGRRVTPDAAGNWTTIVPAVTQEGFDEADLTIAPNGDIICMMRSGGRIGGPDQPIFPTPMYMSRSTDNGETWSVPRQVADRGCCPYLVTMSNGLLVCAYTRPGNWLMFSDDNGHTWKGNFQLSPADTYCNVKQVAPDTLLAFYRRDLRDHINDIEVNPELAATFFTVRPSAEKE